MGSKDSVERLMSDVAAAIRTVFPKNGPKLLARLMRVPLGTAHEWYYRRIPDARVKELAAALIGELEREKVSKRALEYRLAQWARGNASEIVVAEMGDAPGPRDSEAEAEVKR